jgi:DTW domain-containing protein YfiP
MSESEEALCPDCLKPAALCVCAGIEPFDSRVELLVLQHPQEQDRELGSARLAVKHFRKGRLAVGLSWPNLTKLVGRPAEPARWGVLYLGPIRLSAEATERDMVILDRKGAPLAEQDRVLGELQGVVLLDGSWSQAKALWWRNPWMLKMRRIVLNPSRPSRYGRLRKEPRRDSVSTLEAAAFVMARLENRPEIEIRLNAKFEEMLARYRQTRQRPAVEKAEPSDD